MQDTSENIDHIIYLLTAKAAGQLTSDELSELERWMKKSLQNKEIAAEISVEGFAMDLVKAWQPDVAKISLARVKQRIGHKKSFKLWPRIGIAAAVATTLFGAGLFYFSRTPVKKEQTIAYGKDIAPGKQGATLTLANGQKILISDAIVGNIASQSGVKVSKTKEGQIIYEITGGGSGALEYNTLSTSRGEQTQVRLPDGSLVFLNAESSLRYPTNFTNQQTRRVSLTGEGYFEISKSYRSLQGRKTRQSFIVESAGQTIEVLGTHFNVNSYADEPTTKTTLLEGSVKVSPLIAVEKKTSNTKVYEKILTPGEQSQLSRDGGIVVAKADPAEAIAWRNGRFVFNDEPLESIMRKISRWYNVDVIYQGINSKEPFWGSVSRFGNVSKVLEKLELTGDVHFKIEGRKIYVTR